jgi:hypothetical protein
MDFCRGWIFAAHWLTVALDDAGRPTADSLGIIANKIISIFE